MIAKSLVVPQSDATRASHFTRQTYKNTVTIPKYLPVISHPRRQNIPERNVTYIFVNSKPDYLIDFF